jgi:hypothetical protein
VAGGTEEKGLLRVRQYIKKREGSYLIITKMMKVLPSSEASKKN